MISRYRTIATPPPDPDRDYLETYNGRFLTSREIEIIMLLFSGYTQNEIGEKLCLSRHTVKNHIANMCKKIGKQSTTELIKFYVDSILLETIGRNFDDLARIG